MSSPTTARIRRQLLAKPGFTRLPVCPHCLKEIPVLAYAEHTRGCEKTTPKPPEKKQGAIHRANGDQPTQKGLVYALFDAKAAARLEAAGAEIARLRQQLRDDHQMITSQERVERCREIARRDCAQMAIVVDQLITRFGLLGSGLVFLRNLSPVIAGDSLELARNELVRMSDPAVWRIA